VAFIDRHLRYLSAIRVGARSEDRDSYGTVLQDAADNDLMQRPGCVKFWCCAQIRSDAEASDWGSCLF